MAATLTAVHDKFGILNKQLRSEMIQRDDEIDIALLALIAAVHVFLLGAPGVAKSMLIDRVTLYVEGMRTFRKLLTPTTTPPELWGPYNVARLKEGHFELVTRGKLPECHVFVAEELFKSTSAVLNGLLMAANERKYEDDGVEKRMPLSTIYGASNELPDDPFLLAFFDRFLFRRDVATLLDPDSRRQLLDLDVDPDPQPLLTWDDIVAAQAAVRAIPYSDDAKAAHAEIDAALINRGIVLSPRRYREMMKVGRAAAFLDGASEVGRVHLEPLIHVCWERPEQARDIQKLVLGITSPNQQEALNLSDAVADLIEELNKLVALDKSSERTTQLMELFQQFQVEFGTAQKLAANSGGRAARLVDESIHLLRVHGKRLFVEQGINTDPFPANP